MRKLFGSLLIITLLTFPLITLSSCGRTSAKTYYIDPERGSDNNEGTSEATAWKSIKKLNGFSFLPGDSVLFKRGGVWFEQLTVSSSGEEGLPIVFSAYGKGNMPEITARDEIRGWRSISNWLQLQGNIWYMRVAKDPVRLWINNNEVMKAESIEKINLSQSWFFEKQTMRLYLFSPGNPAQTISSIIKSSARPMALLVKNKDNLVFAGLEFSGGEVFSAHLIGSSGVVFEECKIGAGSGRYGLYAMYGDGGAESNNCRISNTLIDSGHRFKYSFEYYAVMDGIYLGGGCNNWEIHNNIIKDWGHSGIQIESQDIKYRTSGNSVHSNEISAENVAYCRGFEIAGFEGSVFNNKVYNNVIRNTTVRSQIMGHDNLIAYNIIYSIRNVSYRKDGTAHGISLEGYGGYANFGNKIINNVIYDTDEPAIRFAGYGGAEKKNNLIANNIFYNCGFNSKDGLTGIALHIPEELTIGRNSFLNNLIFSTYTSQVVQYRGEKFNVSAFNSMNQKKLDKISGNIQQNPLFTDVKNKNFRPVNNSPVIDNGYNAGLSFDHSGARVFLGKGVDIGAYEIR